MEVEKWIVSVEMENKMALVSLQVLKKMLFKYL